MQVPFGKVLVLFTNALWERERFPSLLVVIIIQEDARFFRNKITFPDSEEYALFTGEQICERKTEDFSFPALIIWDFVV